eukprot:gene1278-11365_t
MSEQEKKKQTSTSFGKIIGFSLVILWVALAFYLYRVHKSSKEPVTVDIDSLKEFTREELAQYDGKDENKPLYLAVKGLIFDVSKGRSHYGPNGGYHIFAGRDASRAFVTGCFDINKEECLSDKIDDFDERQKKDLEEWYQFYLKSEKYFLVGKLKK